MPGRMAKVKEDNGEQIGEEVTIFLIAVTCVEFFKILTRLMLHAVDPSHETLPEEIFENNQVKLELECISRNLVFELYQCQVATSKNPIKSKSKLKVPNPMLTQ